MLYRVAAAAAQWRKPATAANVLPEHSHIFWQNAIYFYVSNFQSIKLCLQFFPPFEVLGIFFSADF